MNKGGALPLLDRALRLWLKVSQKQCFINTFLISRQQDSQ